MPPEDRAGRPRGPGAVAGEAWSVRPWAQITLPDGRAEESLVCWSARGRIGRSVPLQRQATDDGQDRAARFERRGGLQAERGLGLGPGTGLAGVASIRSHSRLRTPGRYGAPSTRATVAAMP